MYKADSVSLSVENISSSVLNSLSTIRSANSSNCLGLSFDLFSSSIPSCRFANCVDRMSHNSFHDVVRNHRYKLTIMILSCDFIIRREKFPRSFSKVGLSMENTTPAFVAVMLAARGPSVASALSPK